MVVWKSFGEFLNMGGYGFYVWGAVSVTFLFMLSEIIVLWARKASLSKRLKESHAMEDGPGSS
jgi:heme exporter protein D